ncbi:MAG TPA: AAA family ATPase [Tepidisphaeraceae bacterium]|jgi:hypothetical protein
MPRDTRTSAPIRLALPAPIPAARSRRARLVARWFGLVLPDPQQINLAPLQPDQLDLLLPRAGEIVLITGPSGAGKSSLLRLLRARECNRHCIDLAGIRPPNRPLVNCFEKTRLEHVLSLLNRVGLSDAWTYLRTPAELSEGQRWRLRLAMAIHRATGPSILMCDEFAALLDRVTAAVVARALRRTIDHSSGQLGAVLVTSHDDLLEALAPDVHVYCDFGTITMNRRGNLSA